MKRILIPVYCMMALCSGNSGQGGSGIDLSNLDTTVNPRQDFYGYACGGWTAARER